MGMDIRGWGVCGKYGKREQWSSGWEGTRGGYVGVRVGEARKPCPYSDGGASSSGVEGRHTQVVGVGQAGGVGVGVGVVSRERNGCGKALVSNGTHAISRGHFTTIQPCGVLICVRGPPSCQGRATALPPAMAA